MFVRVCVCISKEMRAIVFFVLRCRMRGERLVHMKCSMMQICDLLVTVHPIHTTLNIPLFIRNKTMHCVVFIAPPYLGGCMVLFSHPLFSSARHDNRRGRQEYSIAAQCNRNRCPLGFPDAGVWAIHIPGDSAVGTYLPLTILMKGAKTTYLYVIEYHGL